MAEAAGDASGGKGQVEMTCGWKLAVEAVVVGGPGGTWCSFECGKKRRLSAWVGWRL